MNKTKLFEPYILDGSEVHSRGCTMNQTKQEIKREFDKVADTAKFGFEADKYAIWEWFEPYLSQQEDRDGKVLKLFKEGHLYSVWLKDGELFVADNANFTLEKLSERKL